MKKELKNLVEQSEVPILKNEIDQLRGTLSSLTNLVLKTEQDLASYRRVTEDLAKELAEHLQIRRANSTFKGTNGSERYYRDTTSVSKRWGEWAEMHQAGTPVAEIARKWGVNHHTVLYARSKGFTISTPKKPKQTKERKQYEKETEIKTHN